MLLLTVKIEDCHVYHELHRPECSPASENPGTRKGNRSGWSPVQYSPESDLYWLHPNARYEVLKYLRDDSS